MIITLQNHCKSPPFASNTDYTTKEVNCLGAIPPTTLEVGESLLNHVEGYVFPQRLYPRTAAGGKGKTFIRFNNKYVFIDLFRICQGLWKFSRKFFAVGLRGKRGWGCPLGAGG